MVDIFILNLIKVNISRRRILFNHNHLKREVYSSFTCGFLLEVFSVRYLRQIDVCLHGYVNSVRYLMQVDGYLSATWGRMTIVCELHEAWWWVSAESVLCMSLRTGWRMSAGSVRCLLLRARWRLSAGVCETCQLITVDWRLSTGGCVICQLLEAGWRLSPGCVYAVCYLRQQGGYLPVTWGRLSVVCKSVCVHSQIIEAGWRLSVSYMRQDDGCLSDTWRRMTVICQLYEAV